ncbi:hypothetical protein [Lysinibacillus sp. LZ02]|uniref:hypothetical protein n=1 Tax=Lysinibacillus sp. LZ02 TaxID=3420668 RepID=UPI003D36CBC6
MVDKRDLLVDWSGGDSTPAGKSISFGTCRKKLVEAEFAESESAVAEINVFQGARSQ